MDKLADFATRLDHLGDLRTDANYEALIIAHEKRHPKVTRAFEELVEAADQSASLAAAISIAVYRQHLLESRLFNGARPSYVNLSNTYAENRLRNSLREKFHTVRQAELELQARCKDLTMDASSRVDLKVLEDLESQILMQHFSAKTNLMSTFCEKILAFRRAPGLPCEAGDL